jgi:hypothetical protein
VLLPVWIFTLIKVLKGKAFPPIKRMAILLNVTPVMDILVVLIIWLNAESQSLWLVLLCIALVGIGNSSFYTAH